jgi:predicted AAA+ superfamily ATPase
MMDDSIHGRRETVAKTNYERVGKGLELLKEGLAPFLEREMKARYGAYWLQEAEKKLKQEKSWQGKSGQILLDVQALFILINQEWYDVFRKTLGYAERNLISELRDVRNKWAHQQSFSTDDAYRALDSIERLLTAISAPQARELGDMKQELLRVRFADQARRELRKAAATQGQPAIGLKPWREIVTPHPDVASGRYQQAEFAADLAQVYRGEGALEYREPREFFRRTFLTEGLRHLLKNALLRLHGKGGDPVVELQTNFGGGKTHSMLALYHLFGGTPVTELFGVEEVLKEAGVDWVPKAYRAVLVGTHLSPAQPSKKPDGTVVRTIWGEMAWQLGGAEGYAMVAESDRAGISPGSQVLRDLFTAYSPCLILIDEWVRYVGQTYGKNDLPAGSFDANITFAQALTEAARQSPETLVVASIPASDIEMGGEGGREALARLRNIFSRMESAWRPASTEEGFEIVRRRLFEEIEPHKFAERDAVIQAYMRMYREQSQEFPSHVKEEEYRRKLENAYPIHPELFDRLFGSWSTLEKFQRTRGVLRLMAAVIHALWEGGDANLLIMPGTLPMDDPNVKSELTRYLEDTWTPVIERDVDGPDSLPRELDRTLPNLGRYSASKRVARTIYLGSAPLERAKNPGIDERFIKLGCVQPGESVATFGDALRRLTDQATHLYVDGSRYWYSTQPSVTRLAQDRAAQQETDAVWEELKARLRKERDRGPFAGVHITPESTADVPDEMAARLVVLGPEYPHNSKNTDSPACQEAQAILNQRGNSPRLYRNMLVFLAPDQTRLADLEQAIRQYLAWKSIAEEKEELNLDAFQSRQAETKKKQAEEAVISRIQETYMWLLVPAQPDPQGPVEWEDFRLQGDGSLAARAGAKLVREELLITQLAGSRLKMDLDEFNLWRGGNHVKLRQVWQDFASYLYLSRLRDENVFLEAVKDGVNQIHLDDNFAYAQRWDEARRRYVNLQTLNNFSGIFMDSEGVLVKPEAARRQLEEEEKERQRKQVTEGILPPLGGNDEKIVDPDGGGRGSGVTDGGMEPDPDPVTVIDPPPVKKLRRFHGTIEVEPLKMASKSQEILREVVQHLAGQIGARVTISIDISAYFPDGVSDDVVRTVTENCRTLKFKISGFEEE